MSARAQRLGTWWWAGSAAAALAGVLLLLPAQATHPRPQAPTHPAGTTAPPGTAAPGTQGPTASPPSPPTAAVTPAHTTAAPAAPLPPPPTAVGGATTQPGGPAGEPAGQAPPSAWLPVARGFARDFADPGPSHQDWMTRTNRWTTASLAALNDAVDPSVVPAATVTAVEPTGVGEDVVDVVATYDTGLRLLYRLQDSPTGWKVSIVVVAHG